MDIVDTRDTLLLWLDSCKTPEQVSLLGKAIEQLIVKAFEIKKINGKETGEHPSVIQSAVDTLLEQMDIHLTILNQKTIATNREL